MKKTRIPLGSPADPPMDPPVWTTARCPPLHDLTPLLKTLLQFGLHLPLPACPFRMWVATFTPRFSVFIRRQLFKRKRCRPHGPGRKRATPVYSRTALACFHSKRIVQAEEVVPPLRGGDWDLRTWPLLAHSRWGGGWGVGDVWGGSASPAPLSGPNRSNFT